MRLGARLFTTTHPARREARGTDTAMFAPTTRLLAQYLVHCPRCDKPAAAHLDESNPKAPVLVRLVCPDACRVDEPSVLLCLPIATRQPQDSRDLFVNSPAAEAGSS